MYAKGTRIELVSMENDPAPIPPGTRGTVEGSSRTPWGETQLFVRWDNGRSIMPVIPPDVVITVRGGE
jgi:hypothetical protein